VLFLAPGWAWTEISQSSVALRYQPLKTFS
jgi:hypothetical protein